MASEISSSNDSDDGQSVGIVQTQFARLFEPPNLLTLESGVGLGPITVAYETYGQLTPEKDNAELAGIKQFILGKCRDYTRGFADF